MFLTQSSVDYDLVILGGTAYARAAALQAVGYGARVALVEPPGLFAQRQQQNYLLKGLQQIGESLQRQAVGLQFGFKGDGALDWQAVLGWSAIAAETQQDSLSVEAMSASGVDVVLEAPQRLTRRLMVETESRRLGARGVLVACGEMPVAIEALRSAVLPRHVSVVGCSAEAVDWAWALSECGVSVDLIADEALPNEDADIRRLVRSLLIASGICVCSEIGDNADTVLSLKPAKPVLELPKFVALKANCRMQMSQSRIFACGSVLGGSTDERLARYEADIAVRNALFLPVHTVDYSRSVRASSLFASVGLSETQAVRRYGRAVQIFSSSDANAVCLRRESPLLRYCKLVCADNRLVGAHLLRTDASDLIRAMASQIGMPVQRLDAALLNAVGVGKEICRNARWQPGRWRRDWAENWFNWQRNR